jgi:hypothetical protein
MQQVCANIAALSDEVCRKYLSDEYAVLCRELAAALARKRPSPLDHGKPEVWACGIVYALGSANFLFDSTQTPYMRAEDLCAAFGVSKSSGANKAKQIRDLMKIYQMDPEWCLPSRVADNPMVWIVEANGLAVDMRHMSREIQEMAFRKGMIPYIPADR